MVKKCKKIICLTAFILLFALVRVVSAGDDFYINSNSDMINSGFGNGVEENLYAEKELFEEQEKKKPLDKDPVVVQNTGDNAEYEGIEVKPYKKSQEVLLDADYVSYDQKSGIAVARGNVYARNQLTTIRAPYVEYDSNTYIVHALSDADNEVIVVNDKSTYRGSELEYNTMTKRGVFTEVSGKAEAIFLNGRDVHFLPADEAVAEKLAKRKYVGKKKIDNKDVIAHWQDVSATTCDFSKPHYKLETKKAIIIPGKATILKKPKLYFSNHCVMRYPFDYIIRPKKKDKFMPMIGYTSKKGAGLGVNAAKYLGKWGTLEASASYWTENMFEASFSYSKQLAKNLSFYAATNRQYNSDDDSLMWRPTLALSYWLHGWNARLRYSENEVYSTQHVIGTTSRYNLSRRPELTIGSPWFFKNFKPARMSFETTFGRYGDDRSSIGETNRFQLLARAQSNFNVKLFNFLSPYYGAVYQYSKYSDENKSTQRAIDAWVGVSYNIGAFNLSTNYYRRWMYDYSPMNFDRLSDDIYVNQTLSFPLPIGPSYSKWRVSLSGYYDFVNDRFPAINYALTYNKHCYTWELWGRHEFYGTENQLGLSFYINAYPQNKLNIGSER